VSVPIAQGHSAPSAPEQFWADYLGLCTRKGSWAFRPPREQPSPGDCTSRGHCCFADNLWDCLRTWSPLSGGGGVKVNVNVEEEDGALS
jgi:hypothetical protein